MKLNTEVKRLKYPSLTNHYVVGKNRVLRGALDKLWYQTEKIHGANASFAYDGENVTINSRRAKLGDNDFVGMFSELKHELENESFVSMLKKLKTDKVEVVYVFGEVFGAGVQNMKYDLNVNRQKGFKVFNVILKLTDEEDLLVLGMRDLQSVVPQEYLCAVRKVDTLRNLLEQELEVDSEYGGSREGNVYKLYDSYLYDNTNDTYMGVKHKHEIFAEVRPVKVDSRTPEERKLSDDVARYVTEARLVNVLSHGGFELTKSNVGNIIKGMQEDILNEYLRENPEADKADVQFAVRRSGSKIGPLVVSLIEQAG